MLVKGLQRLVAFIGPLLFLLYITINWYDDSLIPFPSGWKDQQWKKENLVLQTQPGDKETDGTGKAGSQSSSDKQTTPGKTSTPPVTEATIPLTAQELLTRNEIFSVSTPSRRYFSIDFGDYEAINPNFIPHPEYKDTWMVIAQQQHSNITNSIWFAELVCNAKFEGEVLRCQQGPLTLPIGATYTDKCQGDYAYFGFNIGPHDARAFYGPQIPYTIYGTQSQWACFGQWVQDLRMLTDWGFEIFSEREFRKPTELQRPMPYGPIEKNWFIFWDKDEQVYAHYDVMPKRVFSKIEADGSAGPDLAPATALSDEQCMQRYMPKLAPALESIHQATNSLSITMCKRADPTCEPNDMNTFVMTIFQHKSFYNFHGIYEPYVMLFNHQAPFGIHGLSTKPLWVHGRRIVQDGLNPKDDPVTATIMHSEMFYITSMSWKTRGQKYHGYIDDVLMLGIGIEDTRSAGIDILAGDIVRDVALCAEPLVPDPAAMPPPGAVPVAAGGAVPAGNPLDPLAPIA